MKKLLTLFLILCLANKSNAQYVTIPDPGFRGFLQARYHGCFNGAGQMDTTCSLIVLEDSLTLNTNCNTLDGLKYFKSLTYLDCRPAIYLQVIPELPATLKYFNCSDIDLFLYSLPTLPSQLEYLDCSSCGDLHSLPALPNSLKYLNCSYNSFSSLPALPASLEYLDCFGSLLTSLPNLPDSLQHLDCSNNSNLTAIPALPSSLELLNCYRCQLTALPTLSSSLKYLNCSENRIAQMPLLPDSLKSLNCYANYNISAMPSFPTGIQTLNCAYNSITALPAIPNTLENLLFAGNPVSIIPSLPNTLRNLDCSYTGVRFIGSLPDSLKGLFCSGNSLSVLPSPLPPNLVMLWCANNQLTFLPPLPSTLLSLVCNENNLTYLPAPLPPRITELVCWHNNIYCLPKLPGPNDIDTTGQAIARVEYDGNKITCISNINPRVFYSTMMGGGGPVQLCNPTNNVNHCESFPTISGYVFYDNNNNGIKDANEYYKSNVQFELSNGSIAYTNNNGYFEIGADSLGSYTITPTAPNYYNIIPSSATYNFTTYDTIVSKDYALQANTIKDSLTIKLTAVSRARPGFSFAYLISYENAGTTTLSPNIVFKYDDTKLTYDSSSNASVVNNGNNLSLIAGSFVPGQQGSFTAYFKVKTTAALGDSLFAKATISDNAVTAADSNQTVIRGAYDPNDKQATPELSPLQIANGTYIDYTIRFQNTGNDTAFNVVISDTLTGELLLNTLELTASSHGCKATVKDNVVYFELLNILLPDSNTNEIKSHGFVSFRIKPHPSVPSGSTINNKAAIYFDYNAPVITNTAGTFIKPFTVVPMKLVSFSAIPQTDNTTTLSWNTVNEINTQQFVIEQGTDGARFNSIKNILAKGKANNYYSANVADANNSFVYYRLKIVDNDGSFAYSPVIKIDRRKNTAGFSVLTNPVKDFIIINTTDRSLNNTSCNIISSQGAVVKSFTIKQGSQSIDMKGISTGIYYLRTANGSSRILIR